MVIPFFLISSFISTFGKTIDFDIHLDIKAGSHNFKKEKTYLNDNPGLQTGGRVSKMSSPIHFKVKNKIHYFGKDLSGTRQYHADRYINL